MPKTTMTEEAEYKLPAGEYFPAQLLQVTEKEINWNDKETGQPRSRTKWVWEFRITDGDYAGEKAWGETEDRLTSREDNLVRQWAEALLNAEIQVGDEFDTDSVIGLSCMLSVRHEKRENKRTGGMFYGCPVDEVLPRAGDDAPPF